MLINKEEEKNYCLLSAFSVPSPGLSPLPALPPSVPPVVWALLYPRCMSKLRERSQGLVSDLQLLPT